MENAARHDQAHIDEQGKIRPINNDNPRELERLADIIKRTVVSLKENKKFADLEERTFSAMQLRWKNFLKLYLASATDGLNRGEAWSLLTSSAPRLLRKLSTSYKHQKLSIFCPVLEMHEERAQPSFISGS